MSNRKKKALTTCGCLMAVLLFVFAVFYPIFSELSDNDHTAHCVGHLRQLGSAFQQYAQDNDDAMPNISNPSGGNTWREAIFRYVGTKESYHCPERRDEVDANGFPQNYAANYSGNYGRTQPDKGKGALAGPGSVPLRRKDYPNPAKLILLLETENNDRPEFNIDDPIHFGPQVHKLWAGHWKVRNDFLLADGHVKSLPPADTYLDDPESSTLFNFWYRGTEKKLSANGVAVLKDAAMRFHR